MKIIIYSLNFMPEKVGIGKYSGELAQFLSEKGNQIRVICAPQYYPEWQTKNNNYFTEKKEKLTIHRCPLYIPKQPNGIKRLLHLISFSITSLPILLSQIKWKPDIIILISPSILCAVNLLLFRLIAFKKIIYHLHIQDFEIDAAFSLGILRGKFITKLISFFELLIFKNFNFVSTISKSMMKLLISKGINNKKVFLFPNWVDIEEIKPLFFNDKYKNSYKEKLGIPPERIIVQYSGSMNKKQGFEYLLPVIEHFKNNEKLFWVFGGEGPTKNELIKKTKNFKNIKFLPLQESRNMCKWLNSADIHIIPQNQKIEDLVFPSKLLPILASGKPIISNSSKDSELGTIIEKVGIRVNPINHYEFINALNILIADKSLGISLGIKARDFVVDKFNKFIVLEKFNDFLENQLEK